MNRREWIRSGIIAGAAGAVGAKVTSAPVMTAPLSAIVRAPVRHGAGARNIIIFAYDGLTWENVAVAQFLAQRKTERPLVLRRVLRSGRGGSCETGSLTGPVTDSAAAAVAWTTGTKVANGVVNLLPDGRPLTTILELARAAGRATGLVTTTRITHATPAAWIAKVSNRNDEVEIARQYLAFRPDVLLGGGATRFTADDADLTGGYANAGYDIVRTAAALEQTNASRVLGLFAAEHLPFAIDYPHRALQPPTLEAMTRRSLDILSGSDTGFVLLVEAGRIDHANHQTDAATMVQEVIAADAALATVLAWAAQQPDTLLILASDHGTGGGAAYGVGASYRDSSRARARLDRQTASFDRMLARLGGAPTDADIADVVLESTGIRLVARETALIGRALREHVPAGHASAHAGQPHHSLAFVLSGVARARASRANLHYVTGQHTAGPVPVAVLGRGADAFDASFVDNTEPFAWMMAALGTHHVNPDFSGSDALHARPDTGCTAPFASPHAALGH